MSLFGEDTPRDEIENWAATKLEQFHNDELVVALHICGWRIVPRLPGSGPFACDEVFKTKWPFNSKNIGFPCPEWCEDISMQ